MHKNVLTFQKLVFKNDSMNYYRLYSRPRKQCIGCPQIHICEREHNLKRIQKIGILRSEEESPLAAAALNLKRW